MAEYLFAYGTLRPALAPAPIKPLLALLKPIGPAVVRGWLYDLGEYPGAVLDEAGGLIRGELLELLDSHAAWQALDAYEGFAPDDLSDNLFVRTRCRAQFPDGRSRECWIYVYHQTLSAARLIESGDYAVSKLRTEEMEAVATQTEPLEENPTLSLDYIRELENKYVMQTYARNPVLFVRGKQSTLYDDRGKAYLDFISGIGVNVLGYDHPVVRRVLREQASLLHTSNLYYHPYQGQLAERLVRASGLARVFFANTGTETTEGALKLARAWQRRQGRTDQYEFVSLTNSFHGRTFGALSITAQQKYREPFEPLVPGVRFVNPDNGADDFAEVRAAINERTAAVVIETIQGESGVYPISDDFLKIVRARCDETGALLILDEVQCGLGRTGKVFAYENTSVRPDILTVAKPLGLGVPLGAFIASEKVADGLQPGDHGTTFGGGPLACRLSLEFMRLLDEGQLMQRVIEIGNYFRKKLRRLQRDVPELIKEVRGLGLMVGMELAFPGKAVVGKMLERGFLMNCTHEVTLRFLPPYIITKAEIKALVENLAEVIKEEGEKTLTAGETPRP